MCNICNKASIYPHHQLPVEIEWGLSKANKSQGVRWEIPFPKTRWGSEASTSCPAGSSNPSPCSLLSIKPLGLVPCSVPALCCPMRGSEQPLVPLVPPRVHPPGWGISLPEGSFLPAPCLVPEVAPNVPPQFWGCRLGTSGWLHHGGVGTWAQNVHSGCSTARQMLGWVRRAEGHGVEGTEKTWGKFCLFSATAPWQRRGGHKAKEFALCCFSVSEGAAGITGWGQGAGPAMALPTPPVPTGPRGSQISGDDLRIIAYHCGEAGSIPWSSSPAARPHRHPLVLLGWAGVAGAGHASHCCSALQFCLAGHVLSEEYLQALLPGPSGRCRVTSLSWGLLCFSPPTGFSLFQPLQTRCSSCRALRCRQAVPGSCGCPMPLDLKGQELCEGAGGRLSCPQSAPRVVRWAPHPQPGRPSPASPTSPSPCQIRDGCSSGCVPSAPLWAPYGRSCVGKVPGSP